jgi:hypothetical protein
MEEAFLVVDKMVSRGLQTGTYILHKGAENSSRHFGQDVNQRLALNVQTSIILINGFFDDGGDTLRLQDTIQGVYKFLNSQI